MKRLILLVLILPWVSVQASDADDSGNLTVTEAEGCLVAKKGKYLRGTYSDYDVFCLANILDEQGKYAAAAALRCSDKDTKKLFGDSCITVWTTTAAISPAAAATPNQAVERDNGYEVLMERIQQIEEEKAANVARYEKDLAEQAQQDYKRKVEAESYLDRLPPTREPPHGKEQ